MALHNQPRQANTDQVLPTWLTYSPIPLPSGGTSYTILRLPLTYYGPSIPLGTDGTWTYGGLSPPAPSQSETATTSTPPPITSSLSSTLPSSTSLPSTSASSTSATRPTTTSFATPITSRVPTSSTSSPSSTATPPAGSQNLRLPIAAIVLIALGAAAAVLLCCLIGALFWRRKVRREQARDRSFYAGPRSDDEGSSGSLHDVPNVMGQRQSLLGNDSFVVLGARRAARSQRSGGAVYQRLDDPQVSRHSSGWTGSDEIGVAYTDLPPPRQRRRTITATSQPQSSSPSHPTSSSQRAFGSVRNGSQRSSLFQQPANQDESPVLPRDSAHGVVHRASDLNQQPIQPPAPTASPPSGPGQSLGAELGILGLGRRYSDISQSLLATSSSGGSAPPRLVVPPPSSLGSRSRSRSIFDTSRPPSHMFSGSNTGSPRASRGHSPTLSQTPASPPIRDTLSWPDSPESEHDESAQLLTAERGNVRSGVGLLGRFSWFARGTGRPSTPPRTSRISYHGWMSPPTEEGLLEEGESLQDHGPSTSDPPTLESKPPASHPGMIRLVSSRDNDRDLPPTPLQDSNSPRPVSSTSGQTIYHDASSQPSTPRSPMSTWLGFLGRASPTTGSTPPVPARPSPLSRDSNSTPLPGPSIPRIVAPPQRAHIRRSSGSDDPASQLTRDQTQLPSGSGSDILDAPAPESLLGVPPPVVPPSPATPVSAPVFPPGLPRLPRTWNFGLLNELGDEPPVAEERWANLRASPDMNWNLRRQSLGQAVRIHSPYTVMDSQVGSVHGGTNSNNGRSLPSHSPSTSSDPHLLSGAQRPASAISRHSQMVQSEPHRPAEGEGEGRSIASRESARETGRPDSTTVSSVHPYPPETLVTESESGRFGFDFGFGPSFGFSGDSEGYDDYDTGATTVSSGSSGHEAVDLDAERRRRSGSGSGQDLLVPVWGGMLRAPPMSAVGLSGWGEQADADPGRA